MSIRSDFLFPSMVIDVGTPESSSAVLVMLDESPT